MSSDILFMIVTPVVITLFGVVFETALLAFAPEFEAAMRRQRIEKLAKPRSFREQAINLAGATVISAVFAALLIFGRVVG